MCDHRMYCGFDKVTLDLQFFYCCFTMYNNYLPSKPDTMRHSRRRQSFPTQMDVKRKILRDDQAEGGLESDLLVEAEISVN